MRREAEKSLAYDNKEKSEAEEAQHEYEKLRSWYYSSRINKKKRKCAGFNILYIDNPMIYILYTMIQWIHTGVDYLSLNNEHGKLKINHWTFYIKYWKKEKMEFDN